MGVSKGKGYLNGVGGSLIGGVSGEALSDRGVVRGSDALVDVVRRLVGDQSGHLQVYGHVREHELNGLVLNEELAHLCSLITYVCDLRAERLALEGVLARLVERPPRKADCSGGYSWTRQIEGAHCHFEALTGSAEHVLQDGQHQWRIHHRDIVGHVPHIILR
jgi:hypothetical protein